MARKTARPYLDHGKDLVERQIPQAIADHQAGQQQIRQQWGSNSPQYTPQYRAAMHDQQMRQLKDSTTAKLDDLKSSLSQMGDLARSALERNQPQLSTADADSAWARAKPVLDHANPEMLGQVMGPIAAAGPEVRRAVRQNLPLYMAGRLPAGAPPKQQKNAVEAALSGLRQAETPHLTDDEWADRKESDELEQGLYNGHLALTYANYAVDTGNIPGVLPSWSQGKAIPVPSGNGQQ